MTMCYNYVLSVNVQLLQLCEDTAQSKPCLKLRLTTSSPEPAKKVQGFIIMVAKTLILVE